MGGSCSAEDRQRGFHTYFGSNTHLENIFSIHQIIDHFKNYPQYIDMHYNHGIRPIIVKMYKYLVSIDEDLYNSAIVNFNHFPKYNDMMESIDKMVEYFNIDRTLLIDTITKVKNTMVDISNSGNVNIEYCNLNKSSEFKINDESVIIKITNGNTNPTLITLDHLGISTNGNEEDISVSSEINVEKNICYIVICNKQN